LGNLRHATKCQNCANQGARKNNVLGVKGVRRSRNRNGYEAQITKGGKTIHLGTRATIEDAAALYWEAARELHAEFARAA
jgi:hypothetical protein